MKNLLNEKILQKIIVHFDLGQKKVALKPLLGGRLHQQWQITTDKGCYVIKQLNEKVLLTAEAYKRYQATEIIAKSFAKVIDAVHAFFIDQNPLLTIDGHTFLVFPYIFATTLEQQQIQPAHLQQISTVLAKIHCANLKIEQAPHVEEFDLDIASFTNHLSSLQQVKADLADAVAKQLQLIEVIIENYITAKQCMQHNLIISHQDLDAKNVLWQQHRAYIIDWEAAGLINQTVDFLTTAIYWTIENSFKINLKHLGLFRDNFCTQAAFKFDEIQLHAAYDKLLANWLNWLDFNLKRTLTTPSSADENLLAIREAKFTLKALPIIYQQKQIVLDTLLRE
ncbi:MAG: phosphotransferase [Pseudomonadota bacterium]